MENKNIFVIVSVMAVISLGGVTVFGANELRNNYNSNQLMDRSRFEDKYEYGNSDMSLKSAKINNDIQEIRTNIEQNDYPIIVVQKGIPLKWNMFADDNNLNYCNNQVIIPSLNIKETINVGENIIQFTPTESGVIPYSCWMGMVSSSIVVVDDINNYDTAEIQTQLVQLAQIPRTDCCSGRR